MNTTTVITAIIGGTVVTVTQPLSAESILNEPHSIQTGTFTVTPEHSSAGIHEFVEAVAKKAFPAFGE